MNDILTPNEHQTAKERGWEVFWAWDIQTAKPLKFVGPTPNNPIKNHIDLRAVIMSRAMAGDQFAARVIQALR